MQSFDVSPNEKSSDLPGPRKRIARRVVSDRAATRRHKAATATLLGPESSPPMPTRSGLTPDRSRPRRSSVNLPAPGGDAPRDAAPLRPGPPDKSDCEMDTPTKKPARRTQAKSSGPSSLRKTASPGPDVIVTAVAASHGAAESRGPPLFARFHTSPETQDEAERRSRRPAAAGRSASEPVTPSKKLSGIQLDSRITKLIRKGPAKDKETQLKNGDIYLLNITLSDNGLRLVKIGRTERDPEGRRKEIQARCKHRRNTEHGKAVAENIPFHGFAEKLIHAELANYRYDETCACGTKHREYFSVDEQVAVEVFERWRDFCRKRPWDEGGTIGTVWSRRLDARAAFDGAGRDFDHGKFARHWGAYTMPWLVERLSSDAILRWKSWFPNRWRAAAVAEMFTIVFLSPSSAWATLWIAAVGALCLIDGAILADLHATSSVARLMEGGSQSLVLWYMSWVDGFAAETKGPPAPEAGPEEAPPRQGPGDDAWPEMAEEEDAEGDGASVSVGDPMDVDSDAGCREPTDDEDGPDSGACSPANTATANVREGMYERLKSLDLNAQGNGREARTE